VAPQVAERQATPEQQKPTVPQKPKGLTKPTVPPKPKGLLKKSGFSKSPASSIKPGNSEEQAKIHENDRAEKLEEILQNISARKIQGHWKKFFENLSAIKTNDYGYKETTYKGSNEEAYFRRYFYRVDENGNTEHVVYAPKPIFLLGGDPVHGCFKQVSGKDERFVSLEPNGIYSFKANLNNIDDLVGTSTVIPGIAVNGHTMIARFGGENLAGHYKKKGPVNFALFENAVKDLKTLHERKTFLADIKTGNFLYDEKNVKFIDVDDRIRMNEVFNFHCLRDPSYITKELMYAVDKPIEAVRKMQGDEMIQFQNYLKTADEYAFLLSIIECSQPKEVSRAISQEFENIQKEKKKNRSIYDEKIIAFGEWRNTLLRNVFIKAHVKPEFHSTIESMLRDPFEYSTNSTDQPYLSEMLDFSKKS